MTEKNIKSRLIHKHDVEANWSLAENFIPKQGELIVYDIDENYDYERVKIGDGITNVNGLPFINQNITMEDIDIFVQAEEPLDAEEGSIWVDLDEDFEPDETVEIEVDATLTQEGMAADAKAVGDRFDSLDTIIATDSNEDGNIELRAYIPETDGPGFNVEIDDTLSIEGAAADAKAVGDEINRLSGEIENAGSIVIDLEGADAGEANLINADTLGGSPASDFVKFSDIDGLPESGSGDYGLPPITSENEGNVLKVVNGVVTWSSELSELKESIGEEPVSIQINSAIDELRQEILGGAW